MREFIVASGDDGRRLEKWLLKAAPALSYAQACRFLRLKKVRVNGKVAKEGATLHAGDVVNGPGPGEQAAGRVSPPHRRTL